jgi:hypothetical protein
MTQIPEEIKKKIKAEAKRYAEGWGEDNSENDFKAGALWYASLHPSTEWGEWQLCPYCGGEGIRQPPYPIIHMTAIDTKCPVCNGAKVLLRPLIPAPTSKP